MSENKEKDRERETSTEKKTSETAHRIQDKNGSQIAYTWYPSTHWYISVIRRSGEFNSDYNYSCFKLLFFLSRKIGLTLAPMFRVCMCVLFFHENEWLLDFKVHVTFIRLNQKFGFYYTLTYKIYIWWFKINSKPNRAIDSSSLNPWANGPSAMDGDNELKFGTLVFIFE